MTVREFRDCYFANFLTFAELRCVKFDFLGPERLAFEKNIGKGHKLHQNSRKSGHLRRGLRF